MIYDVEILITCPFRESFTAICETLLLFQLHFDIRDGRTAGNLYNPFAATP
jgi:hypothetical protein